MATAFTRPIELPLDLLQDLPDLAAVASAGAEAVMRVPDEYEAMIGAPGLPSEVFAIQRLLTFARAGASFRVQWGSLIAERVAVSAALFPLLAVVLSLTSASHSVQNKTDDEVLKFIATARKAISKYRLTSDLFSLSQIALCADNRGQSRPRDLYDSATGSVAPRENFETMVLDVIAHQVGASVQTSNTFKNATALGVIVAELFENTDMHGRLDLMGRPLFPDAMRGLAFKRVVLAKPPRKGAPKNTPPEVVDCLEVLIFDTGIGYYPSYTRRPLEADTSLAEEWKVLHNCLERHFHPELEDNRSGHRAMGLAEVLRSIQALKGRIEVRTGRLFAYRTFMDGELQAQMEEVSTRFAHIAWPRPKLLDVEKKYLAIPSGHEPVVGSAVRVVVPLS